MWTGGLSGPNAVGVYETVHVLESDVAEASVHAAGANVPVPFVTEKLTVPVGAAFVTVAPVLSTPVSVTVTVHVLVAWLRFRTGSGHASVVVVTWPLSTVVVPVSVSRLKKPLQMPGPLPTLLVVAALIELVAGVLITLGLFTRLAAFIASGEMAVGYFMSHFPKSFWPGINMGDAAILFCFVFLYIAAAGPGAWSIDGARPRNAPIR